MQKERAPHHLPSTEKDSFKETSNAFMFAGGLSLVVCNERMDKDSKVVSLEKASPGRKLAPDQLPKYTLSIKMIAFFVAYQRSLKTVTWRHETNMSEPTRQRPSQRIMEKTFSLLSTTWCIFNHINFLHLLPGDNLWPIDDLQLLSSH